MQLAEAKELFKQLNNSKQVNSITADAPRDEYQIDLLQMDKIAKKPGNKHMNFALTVIDVYSRYLWVFPIKDKRPVSVLNEFKKIDSPKSITSDSGSEFKGGFGAFLKDHKINHFTVEIGDHRSLGIIDRVHRTIRTKLRILWTVNNNFDWVSHIDGIVKKYNHTTHRTIKNTPYEVFHGKKKNMQKIQRSTLINQFSPGVKVRKLLKKELFSKGGQQWSRKIFTVVKRVGFKLQLNDESLFSPRDLQITAYMTNQEQQEPTLKEKLKTITKAKTHAQLLKKELGVKEETIPKIMMDNSRPKRERKKNSKYKDFI